MQHLFRLIVTGLFAFCGTCAAAWQEPADSVRSHHIKINAYKPFIGFANIGYEHTFANGLGLQFFNEYMIPESFLIQKKYEHPVYVAEFGARKYFFPGRRLYAGAHTGFTLARKGIGQPQGAIFGLQAGYRHHVVKNWLFLEVRALGTYNTDSQLFLPGAELHLGVSF